MAEPAKNALILPFEAFVTHLRRQGFVIGVEHHLRLRTVLNRCADDCSPDQLKTLLCPVIATNARQQEFFYRAFDQFYPLLRASAGASAAARSQAGSLPAGPRAKPGVRRWPYLAAAAAIALISVLFFTWITRPVPNPALKPGAATPAPPTPPTPAPAPAPASAPPSSSDVSTRVENLPPSAFPALSWFAAQRVLLGWTAVLAPFSFWLLAEFYHLRRRRLVIRNARGKAPPYSWPLNVDRVGGIYEPREIAEVGRLLHRRYRDESLHLDVAATVQASIAALGFPTFRYRHGSRLPEYLFLIDRASYRDHWAHIHMHLATELRNRGLYVAVFFYEGDPRTCWNAAGDESYSLSELHRTHHDHRLLVFGDGEQFLDAVTGRMAPWRRLVEGWTDRALLTPEPPAGWGAREATLAELFVVVPATLEGLARLAAGFEIPAAALAGAAQKAVYAPPGSSDLGALRRQLGDDCFRWLCACAIYPELHWDLTLFIGSLASMPAGLVTEKNVIKLLRLEWFRAGSMPAELRQDLMAQLAPEVAREVRAAIVRVLENNRPPAGTFAAGAHQFQIAYQRYRGAPADRAAKQALSSALENLSANDLEQDYTYLEAAESVRGSPLQFILPRRLMKVFYPPGGSLFGLRRAVRAGLAAALAVGLLVGLKYLDGRVQLERNRYQSRLLNGLGLSVAAAGAQVRIQWAGNSAALRGARSGTLTIADGNHYVELPLTRQELDTGLTEYDSASADLTFELHVLDEAGNETAQRARLTRVSPQAPPVRGVAVQPAPAASSAKQAPSAKEAPPAAVRIAGRVFQAPVKTGNPLAADKPIQTPAPPSIAVPFAPDSIVGKALSITGVAPPPAAPVTREAGQTYALLVGISQYRNTDLNLQYAAADARSFAELLESPRGGGLPPGNVLLLTDEQATTGAIRTAFDDLFRRRATTRDTVIVLLVAHGTVDTPGSKEAFMLSYDADPQDLPTTALPIAELQRLFDQQSTRVARTIVFVDIAKAGVIGSLSSANVNSAVQDLGGVGGEVFGIVASRPREVSYEGPQFGGGHGAFTYFLIRGLNGEADADSDGVVTAAELIDYVSEMVPDATQNKQHPREFGVYDNRLQISDPRKPGINLF